MSLPIRLTRCCGCARCLGLNRRPGRGNFCARRLGASIIALTARQVGKTTTAAWAIAHHMLFTPGGLSVIGCPAHRQSAEAVRRVRENLIKLGAELKSDNVYGLELKNGSRVLALPGSDDSIRGLTVDGWIVADEAARVDQRPDRRVAADAGPAPASAALRCCRRPGAGPTRSGMSGTSDDPVLAAAQGDG